MPQVTINQSGLSLGEVQAIYNLFCGYTIEENEIEPDYEYASILEIEFIKDKKLSFFEFIPMDKWCTLIEIIKNAKKRRGKKGLKFKSTITESHSLRKIIFLLNHKGDMDFNKGLERIEIAIENAVEINEFQNPQEPKQKKNTGDSKNLNENKLANREMNLLVLVFDEIKRRWVKSTDKAH